MLLSKSQNVLTMVISIFIGVSNRSEAVYFSPKMWFCQRSKFLPWNSNFYRKLKITCYNLPLFII